MAVAGSLQLSHELGLCGNQGCHRRIHHKGMISRGRFHLPRHNFRSNVPLQRLDSWSLLHSGDISKPPSYVHHRITAFRCHSFLGPHQASKLYHMKAAGTTLIRSCNAIQGNPQVLKVVSAVGIIVFALWGLGPLMRNSRVFFIPKGESGWKKSSAYYIMTTYLQPLLLWSGAILICRALDPVVLPTEASQVVKQRLLNFLRSLSTVLAFAYCLTGVIQQAQKFFTETSEASDTRNMGFQFAGKALYSAVWVAAVSLFMELLGFSTQRWLTAGGLGTVLLTLAGREIFTNFLSSVMIHATRPFVLNEWIQTKIQGYDVSGTVEHVGWWSPTVIRGDDREAVHIPNHKFTVTVVRNLSQKTHWRIKTHIAISHLDVNKINNIVADMRKVIAKNPQIEQQRLHRRVFLDNIHPENQALLILVSCFVKTSRYEEYLGVKEAILMDLLRVISHHRARLATPIRTVQKIYGDADLENVPFADSSFSGAGTSSHRPLLLIEPPYRINGEDKSKIRSGRTMEEQDSKTTAKAAIETKIDDKTEATPMSDSKVGDAHASEMKPNSKSKRAHLTEKEELYTAASDSGLTTGETFKTESSVKTDPRINNKNLKTTSSDSNVPGLAIDGSAQKISEKKQPTKTGSGNNLQGHKSINPSTSSSESGSSKTSTYQASFQSKQPSERLANGQTSPSISTLEDNIILGVALEGSKRTLPIEEGMDLPPRSAEEKELAANGNNNSVPTDEMDQKDGQITQVPLNSSDK